MIFLQPNSRKSMSFQLAGGKAARLGIMVRQGIPVPDYCVISTKAFLKYHQSISARFKQQLGNMLSSWNSDGSALAVRSSAPFEDHASFSMAGQFQTILNVEGRENVLPAVLECWQSLNTRQVSSYLAHIGFKIKKPAIAVLLQKMLQPEYAGVLFTRHPVSGDSRYYFIEIVPGCAESLVSGTARPVKILVDRNDLDFTIMDGPDLPDSLATLKTKIPELVKLSIKIEKIFGTPQDIEWAVENGKLWILQARPITNAVSQQRVHVDKHGEVWTDYFFAERFTKPLSPLGWSVLKKWMEKNAYREPLKDLGFTKISRAKHITRLINGYPFTHISVFQSLYSIIPLSFISKDKQASLLLSHRKIWLADTLRGIPYLVSLIDRADMNWLPAVNLRNWRRFMIKNTRELSILKQLPADKSAQVFHKTESLTNEFLSLHRWSITFADIFYELLKFILKLVKVQDPTIITGELLTGFAENETMRANRELMTCSRDKLPGFLELYGHRSESLDIYQPTWNDNPQLLHRLLSKGKNVDLTQNQAVLLKNNKNVETSVLNRIKKSPYFVQILMIPFFKIILKYAKEFTLLRENQRNEWHKILSVMRDGVKQMGEQWASQGFLPTPDDVFFLDRTEFLAMIKNNSNMSTVVQTRKKQYLKLEQYHNIKDNYKNHAPVDEGDRFEGFGVSKGICRGVARIARTLSDAQQAESHEILIAHSADPAWSPVFSVISGMVLETGGILSHASIVAREFGLPAVTGIANATRLIKNGDLLEINGETGTVDLIQNQRNDS